MEEVHDHDNQSHLEGTRDLEVQGCLPKTLRDSTHSQIVYRSKAVWSLPAKQMTFAVNSTQDTLPQLKTEAVEEASGFVVSPLW